jgi:hypothetical protein
MSDKVEDRLKALEGELKALEDELKKANRGDVSSDGNIAVSITPLAGDPEAVASGPIQFKGFRKMGTGANDTFSVKLNQIDLPFLPPPEDKSSGKWTATAVLTAGTNYVLSVEVTRPSGDDLKVRTAFLFSTGP